MKRLIAWSALLLLAAPVQAQWAPVDEVLQVRVRGQGVWVVSCQWQTPRGEPRSREVRGSGRDRWERLHALESFGGTCSYQAAPSHPLTIQLRSPLYRCTLPAREPEACQQTFPAGASGQFEIRQRG